MRVPDPPSVQTQVRTRSGYGQSAFVGPYVDQSRTQRDAVSHAAATYPSKNINLGITKVYDPVAADGTDPVDHTPDNPPTNIPPAPMAWAPGRNVYANGGTVGQPFFDNSGD